jgi:hypothetical protein
MEQAEFERARQMFEDKVRTQLAATPIAKIELLQYGDDPAIEPGELLGRITFALPEGADPADETVREQTLKAVDDAHRDVGEKLRPAIGGRLYSDFKMFISKGPDGEVRGPLIEMKWKPGERSPAPAPGDQSLTAVMARLGREDLETLDTLIAVGIAGNRAEAVRWTLARIRERPAYEQLRTRAREIEDLKSQF